MSELRAPRTGRVSVLTRAWHLERVLSVFIDHDNGWRLHRNLALAPPNGRTSMATWTETQPITLKRRDRLGGLLHEYERGVTRIE